MTERERLGPKPSEPGVDYDVGYSRPPKHTQFQKGKSGNPTGRKKRGTTMRDIVERAATELVQVKINGVFERLPMNELLIKKTYLRAAEGNAQALKQVLAWFDQFKIGAAPPEQKTELPSVMLILPHNGRNDKGGTVFVPDPDKPMEEWERVRTEDAVRK